MVPYVNHNLNIFDEILPPRRHRRCPGVAGSTPWLRRRDRSEARKKKRALNSDQSGIGKLIVSFVIDYDQL